MTYSIRLYAFIAILSTLVAVIAVLGDGRDAPPTCQPLPPRVGDGFIAYVSPEGQINTVSPDGCSAARVSPERGFFTWPAWSPEGSRLAFSGTSPGNNGRGPLALYVHRRGEDSPAKVFVNKPGMGPILNGMPHYPLWAPDGGWLALMASDPQGLTLFLTDPRTDDGGTVVLRKAPLYATWAADSGQLLVHGGPDHFLVDVKSGVRLVDLGEQAANYRVPAWWPSGNRIAFVARDRSAKHVLYIADMDSDRRVPVEAVPGGVAFLWSPNGRSLAVAHSELPGGLTYGGVRLFSHEGVRRPVEIPERVLAFFWSPDSTKIAYVTPSDVRGELRWMVMNVAEGRRWPLVEFTPSRDQFTMFQFFDQFAKSHSLWSPDGRSLVFCRKITRWRRTGLAASTAAPSDIRDRSRTRCRCRAYRRWISGGLVTEVKRVA